MMPDRDPEAFRALLKPAAVRERAQEMLELGLAGKLLHFIHLMLVRFQYQKLNFNER